MSYLKETPLGRSTDYVDEYMPSLLCPVPAPLPSTINRQVR